MHSPVRWEVCSSALETGTPPDISGRDNLRTIALCEAVLAAGRGQGVANLGEFTG